MTREEIIKKGEKLLIYTLNQALGVRNCNNKKYYIQKGLAQLDMLYAILDEDWEDYQSWFKRFMRLF